MKHEIQSFSTPVFSPEGLRKEMGAVDTITREFLLSCVGEGVVEKVPKHTQKNWERNIDMTFRYFLTEETQTDMAPRYGLTSQAISFTIQQTLEQLWLNASGTIQDTYSFDALSPSKNLGLSRALAYFHNQPNKVINRTTRIRYRQTLFEYISSPLVNLPKK